MIRTRLTLAALAMAAALFAQNGPKGPQMGPGQNQQPAVPMHSLDLAAVVTIAGPITTVNVALGVQHPSIVVDGKTIELAPAWWLLEKGLELKEGDKVEVIAAPCLDPDKPWLFAIKVINVTTGTTRSLRDENGVPLWVTRGGKGQMQGPGSRSGQGNGPAECSGCFDPASLATTTGTVESVNAGFGIQMPVLTLKTTGGLLTLKIGPERILLESGFTIKAGDTLTVKYGQSICTDELIAVSLTNNDGVTVILRDDSGRIVW